MKCFDNRLFVNVDVLSSVKFIYSYLAVNITHPEFSSLFRSIDYSSILEQIFVYVTKMVARFTLLYRFLGQSQELLYQSERVINVVSIFLIFCFFVLYVVISLLLPSVQKQLSIYCVVEQEAENVLKK